MSDFPSLLPSCLCFLIRPKQSQEKHKEEKSTNSAATPIEPNQISRRLTYGCYPKRHENMNLNFRVLCKEPKIFSNCLNFLSSQVEHFFVDLGSEQQSLKQTSKKVNSKICYRFESGCVALSHMLFLPDFT